MLFCPIGNGSSATGYSLTVDEIAEADVVGVQSKAAPTMGYAQHEYHLDPGNRMDTSAEEIARLTRIHATRSCFQSINRVSRSFHLVLIGTDGMKAC